MSIVDPLRRWWWLNMHMPLELLFDYPISKDKHVTGARAWNLENPYVDWTGGGAVDDGGRRARRGWMVAGG
jgi:hypothetical protein